MIFNTLIMHFLLNGTFSLPHTWTRSLFYPIFKFLFLHKSFGLNIWPSPILQLIITCTPVVTIWSCHHLLSGFYQCLLFGLGSMFVNFKTHSQYFIYSAQNPPVPFATQNLKSLWWSPMSLWSESITLCLTQLRTNLACFASVPWISLLWTKHKSPIYFSDMGSVMCSWKILSMM